MKELGLGYYLLNISLELHMHLAYDNVNENIVCSPFSIATALSILLAGARSSTADEISGVLHVGNKTEDNIELFSQVLCGVSARHVIFRIADILYTAKQLPVRKEYTTLLEDFYRASTESVDFAHDPDGIRREMNEWLLAKTNSEVPNLLVPGSINAQTTLILLNAIYFKGNWESHFSPRATRSANFHLDSENTVKVSMMHIKQKFKVAKYKESEYRAVEVPYKGGEYSMLILLPDKVDGLTSLEERLTENGLRSVFEGLESGPNVKLSLPKFKVQHHVGVKDVLRALGVNEIFDKNRVDLSGMFKEECAVVSNIIHGAVVEVNENGTEAADDTAVMSTGHSSDDRRQIKFVVDHPFMFIIKRNEDNLILFMGSIRNPE